MVVLSNSNTFLKYAKQVVDKQILVNGESYISSVYREGIKDGLTVKTQMSGFCYDLSTEDGVTDFLWYRNGQ